MMSCIFDDGARGNDRITNTILWFSVWDGFPVTSGHALLIPYRHVDRVHDLTLAEWQEFNTILLSTQFIIENRFQGVDGYTIGINDGEVAGQTIKHVHCHLIPRRPGDMDDPRGGIRRIFADAPRPWEASESGRTLSGPPSNDLQTAQGLREAADRVEWGVRWHGADVVRALTGVRLHDERSARATARLFQNAAPVYRLVGPWLHADHAPGHSLTEDAPDPLRCPSCGSSQPCGDAFHGAP